MTNNRFVFGFAALASVGFGLALLTTNPLLTALALASLCAIILISWRSGEAPALAFACLMQWLSSALAVLRADWRGVPVWNLSFTHHYEEATALSLIAVVVFALGARITLGWRGAQLPASLSSSASGGLERRLVTMWLVTSVAMSALTILGQGGLTQIIRTAQLLKWVPVFVLFLVVLNRGRNYGLLVTVLLVEIGMGFLSFFSDFKTPLYLLAIAFAGSPRARGLSARQLLGGAAVGLLTLGLGVVWTAIKPEYRDYVNQGTNMQAVSVSREEQVDKLVDLMGALDPKTLDRALETFGDRVMYVEFFAAAMDYVPAVQPHENGGRTLAALQHVLAPRMFFPNKAALNDTVDTERYTGLDLSSEDRSTSISLGYPAEAYVDGGVTWMFAPIMFFGMLYGAIARRFMRYAPDPILGTSIGVIVLLNMTSIELGFTKLLGGVLMMAMVFELVLRLAAPRISAWLWTPSSDPAEHWPASRSRLDR